MRRDEAVIDQIIEACQPYWTVRDNDIHVPESYEFARRLLAHYPEADPLIVLPAILMHDNGYANVPQKTLLAGLIDAPVAFRTDITRLHEIEGVKIAREILGRFDFNEAQTEAICDIIDGHDSRKTAVSLEDKLVKDADKLWRFSVSGVRTASGWMAMSHSNFLDYVLSKADGWLFTNEAKEMARKWGAETRIGLDLPAMGVAFMLIDGEQVLAERRAATKTLLPSILSIPGGHGEKGETAVRTLYRELHEELNLIPTQYKFVCTLHHRSTEFRQLHYFAVEAWKGKMVNLEAASLHWVGFAELERLDLDVDRLAVKEYLRLF
ncbi:MAG: HD domain-containing protein [Chloroflexota bacterium]